LRLTPNQIPPSVFWKSHKIPPWMVRNIGHKDISYLISPL
jgi:hypothetical protein